MIGNEEGSSETSHREDISDDQRRHKEQQSVEDSGDSIEVPGPIGPVGDVQSSLFATLAVEPYNPRKFHDMVRSVTNFSFIGIFALTIIASLYVVIWRGSDWTNEKDLLQLLLPAETALLGSAVGFYFGSQVNRPDGK